MVLVDTSAWVDHLREGDGDLAALLEQGQVVMHPLIIGELACGNLRNRRDILGLLQALPQTPTAQHDEVLQLIDSHSLAGYGLGYIDIHLLAAALLAGVALWTRDKRLAGAAAGLSVRYTIWVISHVRDCRGRLGSLAMTKGISRRTSPESPFEDGAYKSRTHGLMWSSAASCRPSGGELAPRCQNR